MFVRDPSKADVQVSGWWQGVGVVGLIGVALILLIVTLWLAQSEGPPAITVAQAGSVETSMRPQLVGSVATPVPGAAHPGQEQPSDSAFPSMGLSELPPVPLTEEVAPMPGIVFSVVGLEVVDASDGFESAGTSALQFTLRVRNDSGVPVILSSSAVTVSAAAASALPDQLAEPGSLPLPNHVGVGATGSAVYSFEVPVGYRGQIRIAVDYAPGAPLVVFEGAAPH